MRITWVRCRWLALLLCAVLLFCACSSGNASSLLAMDAGESADEAAPAASLDAVVALVTTESRYDTAFGQAVWQAMNRFVGEQGLHGAVYKAEDGDEEAARSTLSLAASGGAQLVVAMGETASLACSQAAVEYPDIEFILLDLPAGADEPDRAVWVMPDALGLGWVAGYTAVSSGMTDLLCLWDESENGLEAGRQYALGFISGCQDAAKQRTADDEAVRLRVLGLTGEDPDIDAEIAHELLSQRPQLVLSCFERWDDVSPWFEGIPGTRLVAPLCQEDVPAGRLWALVEQEPTGVVTELLAAWQGGGLTGGECVYATVEDGGTKLAAGLAGCAQDDLDEAAQVLSAAGRKAGMQRAADVQGEVFPDLEPVDFPDLHLLMLPRDAAPPQGSGTVASPSPSPAADPAANPVADPAPVDNGGAQDTPPAEAQPSPTPVPGESASSKPTQGAEQQDGSTVEPDAGSLPEAG